MVMSTAPMYNEFHARMRRSLATTSASPGYFAETLERAVPPKRAESQAQFSSSSHPLQLDWIKRFDELATRIAESGGVLHTEDVDALFPHWTAAQKPPLRESATPDIKLNLPVVVSDIIATISAMADLLKRPLIEHTAANPG